MIRYTTLLLALFTLLTAATCNPKIETALAANCFKGKLVIKGICMNYVVQLVEGDSTRLQLARTWIDETTDKTYNNVFALASKCNFPEMQEGDEFYFTVSETDTTNCNVCMAYRPVPDARNFIVVNKERCP